MYDKNARLAHCVFKYLLWRAAAIAEPHSVSVAALRDYWWRQAMRENDHAL